MTDYTTFLRYFGEKSIIIIWIDPEGDLHLSSKSEPIRLKLPCVSIDYYHSGVVCILSDGNLALWDEIKENIEYYSLREPVKQSVYLARQTLFLTVEGNVYRFTHSHLSSQIPDLIYENNNIDIIRKTSTAPYYISKDGVKTPYLHKKIMWEGRLIKDIVFIMEHSEKIGLSKDNKLYAKDNTLLLESDERINHFILKDTGLNWITEHLELKSYDLETKEITSSFLPGMTCIIESCDHSIQPVVKLTTGELVLLTLKSEGLKTIGIVEVIQPY